MVHPGLVGFHPHFGGGWFQRQEDAHGGVLAFDDPAQVAHIAGFHAPALDLHQDLARPAFEVFGEDDHAVDAAVGAFLAGLAAVAALRFGADERHRPPLELVRVLPEQRFRAVQDPPARRPRRNPSPAAARTCLSGGSCAWRWPGG